MPVETADDRATFFNVDEFGVEATWSPSVGGPALVAGIVEDAAMVAQGFAESGYVNAGPSFVCPTDDVPAGAAQGDGLVVDGVSYKVVALLPDGTGITRATLERAT